VAFDQHADSVVMAVLGPADREPATTTLPADVPTIVRAVRRLHRRASCVYEAGPCGFGLQRALTTAGLACAVIAPALIPRQPGARVKTDRRDARQLAVLARAGALTPVRVPSEADEAARDLVRTREATLHDLQQARHRLAGFLLRHGRRYRAGRAWTQGFWTWLRREAWVHEATRQTCLALIGAVNEAQVRLQHLTTQVTALATQTAYQDAVHRLQAYRGVDVLTAVTVVLELGDPRRFAAGGQVMAYVGLVPREHSSGATRRLGRITKTGNAHLRRVLVEAAWQYRHAPRVSAGLQRRRQGLPAEAVRRADQAQRRLHQRYRQLIGRGKRAPVVVTAIARELIGHLWGALVADPHPATGSDRSS
jgi:transposase